MTRREPPERRLPRWLGWKRMLPLAIVAGLIYYLVNLVLVVAAGDGDEPSKADAIVVLGAAQYNGTPSPQLAARLDHALELYERGVSDTVLLTGGNQPGDNFTEAQTGRNYLSERGVPEEAMLSEDEGTNTFNSLRAAATVLRSEGLRSVVLVTDPYHAERSELIADEVGLAASSSPTPTSVVTGGEEFRRQLVEAAGVSLGRIIGFERLTSLTG